MNSNPTPHWPDDNRAHRQPTKRSSILWACVGFVLCAPYGLSAADTAAATQYYREPSWQPRIHPTLADLLGGDFHPAPPPLQVSYATPGYRADRVRPAPALGMYPRVLITPEDVADIRQRVALGSAAPAEFRALWQRIDSSGGPLAALVKGDAVRGRHLADEFVAKLDGLAAKLDRLDAQPDRENLWSAERSLVAAADPDPPHELWSLLDYDYLHVWMTDTERELAARVIERVVVGRFSNFMAEPDTFMINNHKYFGMEFIRLLLLVEGRPAFPTDTFTLAAAKARAMLDWYLSPDGMCYESIKGWLNVSAMVAVGRRQPDLLRHGHLVAKMNFFLAALRREGDAWIIREEMRASAFHVIWLMRFLYPDDLRYDLLYNATLQTHPFLTDPAVRWPDPVGIAPELLLLLAAGGSADNGAGTRANWNSQPAIDSLELPILWQDNQRGYLKARNSWRIGDLHLAFVNKQDFYYGGHEGSEANRITLWKDGINWLRDEDLLAVKATGLQNMLTVNGRGLSWPPVPGTWLGVQSAASAVSAAGDARMAYTYGKVMQVHPLSFPSGQLPYYAPFTEGNFDLGRDLQVAFHPATVAWNDGYAHTDYGPWSGETRLVEHYRDNNPMAMAYRTVHLARGDHPYVLLFDDAAKADGGVHLFEASFNLPDNAVVVDAKTTEVQYQNVEPSLLRESEFLIGTQNVSRDPTTGRPLVKRGEPLLLVRILHRNTDYGYPVPRVQVLPGRPERPFNRFTQLVVPAVTRSPEFRILFYPHRHGDPLPITRWDPGSGNLSVSVGKNHDSYQLATGEGGRTVFRFTRNGAIALENAAPPPRPVLIVHGERFDPEDLRDTRLDGSPPRFPFGDTLTIAFARSAAGYEIRYTLDGTEPGPLSPRYSAPLVVDRSAVIQARTYAPHWPGSERWSRTTTAKLAQVQPAVGTADPPANSIPGLQLRVYELNTKMWDDRGFFRADLPMLPKLDQYQPLALINAAAGFALPHVIPAAPLSQQTKGFYRFTGFFHATRSGIHHFAVDSCGPVRLRVAGQDAIAVTGVFHLHQTVRAGSAVLTEGWHPIELIVTDPQFWNVTTMGPMPFTVSSRGPHDEHLQPVANDRLRHVALAESASMQPAIEWLASSREPPALEPGLQFANYDRTGLTRSPSFFDTDNQTPYSTGVTDQLTGNSIPHRVVAYHAWFQAPVDGIYHVALPASKPERIHLGAFRSAYQNQVRIGSTVVAQRGVAGRLPHGSVGLRAGWHPLTVQLGSSSADIAIGYPDGQTVPLAAVGLMRPAMVRLQAGNQAASSQPEVEILGPTQFTLIPPPHVVGEIHYTLDGSQPSLASPTARAPFQLATDASVRATVFSGQRPLTQPSRHSVKHVTSPARQLIADIDFARWDGSHGIVPLDQLCRTWIAPFAKRMTVNGRTVIRAQPVIRETGPGGVDINMTRGAGLTPLKLHFINMREDTFTVGLWFLLDSPTGRLLGKQGLTAFGKSYRTIAADYANNRLTVNPGRLVVPDVRTGRWHHLVITVAPDQIHLFLDGTLRASARGVPGLTTDSLDFLPDTAGAIGRIAIFDRILDAPTINAWYDQSRTQFQP
jgi:hypothetical protein